MNVVLIGLRGTGKSTCGKLLAQRLRWIFIDTDAVVQEHTGKSIREIFAEGGETHFRRLEAAAVRQATQHVEAVIACGGGAVLNPENVADMRRQGFVIHLSAPPAELWGRIESDQKTATQRPTLLSGSLNGMQELEKLQLNRSAAYSAARDTELNVSGRTPEQVVEAMVLLLHARGVLKGTA